MEFENDAPSSSRLSSVVLQPASRTFRLQSDFSSLGRLSRQSAVTTTVATLLSDYSTETESELFSTPDPNEPVLESLVQSLHSRSIHHVTTTTTTTTDSPTGAYFTEFLAKDFQDFHYFHDDSVISTLSAQDTATTTTSSMPSFYPKVFIGIFLVLVILISIFGNLLICVAIYSDRKLRRLGNIFIVSLAIADLCVGALVMTFALANDLLDYWPFGPQLCEIWIAFDISCSTCSIINLCAIALDRFVHIKDPMRYNRWISKRIVIGSVSLIWLVSCLISFVPISLGWHRPVDDYPSLNQHEAIKQSSVPYNSTTNTSTTNTFSDLSQVQSIERHHSQQPLITGSYFVANNNFQCALDLTPTYAVVSSIISFYLPCIVMLYLYAKLYAICQQHVRSIQSMSKPSFSAVPNHHHHTHTSTTTTTNHSPKPSLQNSQMMVTQQKSNEFCKNVPKITTTTTTNAHHSHTHHQQQKQVTDHKAAITLGIIMGTFLACWMPFFCMNIVAAFCKTCIPGLVFKILTWLGYFNSCLNPAIYSIFNTEFRDAFRRILIRYLFNGDLNSGSGMCSVLLVCRDGASIDSPDHLSYSGGGGGGGGGVAIHNQHSRNSNQSFNTQLPPPPPQSQQPSPAMSAADCGGNSRQNSSYHRDDRSFTFEPSIVHKSDNNNNSARLLNDTLSLSYSETPTVVQSSSDNPIEKSESPPAPSVDNPITLNNAIDSLLFPGTPSSSSSSSSSSTTSVSPSSSPSFQHCPKQSSLTVLPSPVAAVLPPPPPPQPLSDHSATTNQTQTDKLFRPIRPTNRFYQNYSSQSFDDSRTTTRTAGSTGSNHNAQYHNSLCKRPSTHHPTHSSTNGISGCTPATPTTINAPFTINSTPPQVSCSHNLTTTTTIQTSINSINNDSSNVKVWEI